MLEQVFARLSSSPFSLSVLPFQIYRQIEFCSEVGGGMWPPGGVCVCVLHWGSLLELELLFRGEVVAGLVLAAGGDEMRCPPPLSPYLRLLFILHACISERAVALWQAPCLSGWQTSLACPSSSHPPPTPGEVLVTL